MSEKIKAIRGSKDRADLIKEWFILQEAKNVDYYDFEKDCIYFMDCSNNIKHCSTEFEYLFDVININTQVIVVQGDSNNGTNVIKYLEDHGGLNNHKLSGDDATMYYYINPLSNIIYCDTLKGLRLAGYVPDIHNADICTLKPFDKILVRDCDEDPWVCDIFSHYDPNAIHRYCCVGATCWEMAIPYEGNEDKVFKVTE